MFELVTANFSVIFKMAKGKNVRDKGKIKLSSYFKKIKEGERVSIVTDKGIRKNYPDRLKGKSGKVVGNRGKHKLVELKEGNKTKTFIIHPVHLKKI